MPKTALRRVEGTDPEGGTTVPVGTSADARSVPASSTPAVNAKCTPGPTRGITAMVSTSALQRGIQHRTLVVLNRLRVIRTLDVAALCFPERPFKAALTAAQRAVRGMVKAGLIRRYKTERFQTIYGLAQRGTEFLGEAGIDAASSVRRTSDMTNPEHRLWLQFLVLACEARGLQAMTEQEVMKYVNRGRRPEDPMVQGMLSVEVIRPKRTVKQSLRPDAAAIEADGITWFEADRSKRGPDREAGLAALVQAIGRPANGGHRLRRVVVFCKTERIELRALGVMRAIGKANNSEPLTGTRRHVREVEPGVFEVWAARTVELSDGRSKLDDELVGHALIQLLPTWLPKVRVDATNKHSTAGWFSENYLPYRRPATSAPWPAIRSPLLTPLPARTTRLTDVPTRVDGTWTVD
ncbi:MAG: hypothetical protein IH627_13120 [Rubrivivax sp.]|nr:hypothetical protein [Rubrivivax sp.]